MAARRGHSARKPKDPQEAKQFLEDRLDLIVKGIQAGLTIANSARAAGVHPQTIHYWKSQAKQGKQPYKDAMHRYEQAIAEGQRTLAGRIFNASATDWRAAAWILERRHAEDWGKQPDTVMQQNLLVDLRQLSDDELDEELMAAEAELRTLEGECSHD